MVGAGNIGLQQSLRVNPIGFATDYPLAVALCLGSAFLAALFFVRVTKVSRRFVPLGVLAVLAGDALLSFVVAPLLVGELEAANGPVVLLAVSLLGLQMVAAAAGAWIGARDRKLVTA